MEAFSLQDTTLHYHLSGKGPALIFLHGFLENHKMWRQITPEFEALGFSCLLIDLPCHGLSRFQGEICSMTNMATVVHQLCEFLGLVHPHIIGHSMGGYVGLELLKLRKATLTLVHSNFWADPAEKKKDRNRVISIVKNNKMRLINEAIPHLFSEINRLGLQDIITELIAEAATIPAEEICASTRGMRDRQDNTELLEHQKISIIQGDSDNVIPLKMMKTSLANTTAMVDFRLIEKCGHMSIWENPAALINSLKLIQFK